MPHCNNNVSCAASVARTANFSPGPERTLYVAFPQPGPGYQAATLGIASVRSTTTGAQGLGKLEKAAFKPNQTTGLRRKDKQLHL